MRYDYREDNGRRTRKEEEEEQEEEEEEDTERGGTGNFSNLDLNTLAFLSEENAEVVER